MPSSVVVSTCIKGDNPRINSELYHAKTNQIMKHDRES